MILTNLTLTNFGIFRGRQTVALAPRRSRPIILFGGANGTGKSTFLEAVRLCLYGPGVSGVRTPKEAYLDYLERRIHSNPTFLIQPTFAAVSLEFQYVEVGILHTYTVTRSWERRSGHKLVEYLEVMRDGEPLDEIAAEHWPDFIRDMIPQGVAQLFFFDGEKIQQLAEEASDQQALGEAIKSLLGLEIVEQLQTDLGIYLARLTKPSQDRKLTDEVEGLQQEIASIQQRQSALRGQREQCENRLAELRAAIARVEAKIASEGGSFARNRDRLVQQQVHLKTRISQHEESIRQLCAGLLPFALIPQFCHQLKDQLLIEERAAQMEAGLTLVTSVKEEILQRVDARDFWAALPGVPEEIKAEIRGRLAQAIEVPYSLEHAERIEMLHQLSAPLHRQLLSWIDQATNDIPKRMPPLTGDLESLYRDLYKVEEALRKIPADEVLKPLLKQLHDLHQELADVGKQALVMDEEIRRVEFRLSELQRRYHQATEKLAAQVTNASRIHLIPRIQKVLEEYESALLEKKVRQLEGAVAECFNILSRKKDAVHKMSINPKDFSVALYDRQNQPLPKAQLSAGEKQIYAISILWALGKISGRPLPIIVDTPLARLDREHRRLLVRHYFPVASHQVILLSTDTEVDQSSVGELRRCISREYSLEFDPVEHSTTIAPGYFWRDTDEAH